MDKTRIKFGTLRIEYGQHALLMEIGLPEFLAEAIHGQETPDQWDDALGKILPPAMSGTRFWSGRFEFYPLNELTAKGQTGRKGVGRLPKKPGVGKGKANPTVRGRSRCGVGGRGLRELPLPYRGQTLPTGNARKMALSGYVGRTTRKGAVSLVSSKWQ